MLASWGVSRFRFCEGGGADSPSRLADGAIGREVARLCSAFGTTIVACNRTGAPTSLSPSAYHVPETGDPHSTLPVQHYSSSSRESLHEFLARCDVVVNTLPGSPSNDELLGEAELKACKGDALIINGCAAPSLCNWHAC